MKKDSFENILIVLGNALQKGGKPSPLLIARIQKAIELYRRKHFDKVVLTGGTVAYPIPEAEVMAVFFHKIVPKRKLILEKKSISTIQNALFTWDILKDQKIKKLVILTSDFHVPRTRCYFEKIFEHMNCKMEFVSAKSNIGLFKMIKFHLFERKELLKLKIIGIT